jgi:hypothetical protein
VQVTRGKAAINGKPLEAGDGVAVSAEARVDLEGRTESEVLVFDLG